MRDLNWHDSTSSYVAFLDILGYKQIVKNNSHQGLKQIYSFNIGAISLHAAIPYELFPKSTHQSLKKEWRTKVKSQIVSDSIIVWTSDDSAAAFIDLIYAVDFMMAQSMYHGIPMRGGICTGEVSWHTDERSLQTIVTGAPIVEAYELSERQNWAGCTISEACIDKCRANEADVSKTTGIHLKWDEIVSNKILIEYQVPMKSGPKQRYWVPNWTLSGLWSGYFGNQKLQRYNSIENVVRHAFSALGKNSNDWVVEEKILNTLKFLEIDVDIIFAIESGHLNRSRRQ